MIDAKQLVTIHGPDWSINASTNLLLHPSIDSSMLGPLLALLPCLVPHSQVLANH